MISIIIIITSMNICIITIIIIIIIVSVVMSASNARQNTKTNPCKAGQAQVARLVLRDVARCSDLTQRIIMI